METAEQNGGSTRASTVDRRRSVTCWRTRVIAVEANDSLETWLTTGRPARSKRDTRAARRRRSEKGRGPGLEPCPRPAWLGRLGADLHPAGRLFEFGEADRQDPLLHGGLDLVGVDGSGQGRAVEEPPGPPVHQVLALLVADRAGDAQAVLVDLQFDVVPGDPGEFGLDRVEHLGLVDLGVRLHGEGPGPCGAVWSCRRPMRSRRYSSSLTGPCGSRAPTRLHPARPPFPRAGWVSSEAGQRSW